MNHSNPRLAASWRWLVGAALTLAVPALAVKPGETLYIKSQDCKVNKAASATAAVAGTLKRGSPVKWGGADDKNKQFHKVESTDGKVKGFTLQANLTPHQPANEKLTSDGQPVSAEAVASSGAATKALSEAGLQYANGKSKGELAAQLIYLEQLSRDVEEKKGAK